MSLRHILLGFLDVPKSGYELRQQFEKTAATFWTANLSQIYPTLKKMEVDGLVKSLSKPPKKGPARIEYRRTSAGKKALADWVRSGPCLQEQRNLFLAQIYFLDYVSVSEAAAFFSRIAEMSQWQHERLSAREAGVKDALDENNEYLPKDSIYKYAALDLGVRATKLYAQWGADWAKRIRAVAKK